MRKKVNYIVSLISCGVLTHLGMTATSSIAPYYFLMVGLVFIFGGLIHYKLMMSELSEKIRIQHDEIRISNDDNEKRIRSIHQMQSDIDLASEVKDACQVLRTLRR